MPIGRDGCSTVDFPGLMCRKHGDAASEQGLWTKSAELEVKVGEVEVVLLKVHCTCRMFLTYGIRKSITPAATFEI